jgi:hypothetical protein
MSASAKKRKPGHDTDCQFIVQNDLYQAQLVLSQLWAYGSPKKMKVAMQSTRRGTSPGRGGRE